MNICPSCKSDTVHIRGPLHVGSEKFILCEDEWHEQVFPQINPIQIEQFRNAMEELRQPTIVLIDEAVWLKQQAESKGISASVAERMAETWFNHAIPAAFNR